MTDSNLEVHIALYAPSYQEVTGIRALSRFRDLATGVRNNVTGTIHPARLSNRCRANKGE
jgi:hypothetical protein